MDFFREFADGLLAFSRDHVYVALLVLLFIEEAGIPLPAPGDTIILLAGAEVANGQASAQWRRSSGRLPRPAPHKRQVPVEE